MMAWNYTFPYNSSLARIYSKQMPLIQAINNNQESPLKVIVDAHVRCIQWLGDNLVEGRDFEFSENGLGTIVIEFIYFDKEEDVLAFKLACGL